MKKILLLFLGFLGLIINAQSKVYLKSPYKIREKNTLIFETQDKVPVQAVSYIIYEDRKKITIPLVKVDNHYEIDFKVPESAKAIIVGFTDKKEFKDNNEKKGFLVYLTENNDTKLSVLKMMDYSNQLLQTDNDSQLKIKEYEKIFKENPALINGENWKYYLIEKYKNGDTDTEKLTNEKIVELQKGNEKDFEESLDYYGIFQNWEERGNAVKKGAEKFPKSKMAKEVFLRENYSKIEAKNYSEIIKNFEQNFGKIDNEYKDTFTSIVLSKLISQPKPDNTMALEFGKLFSNQLNLASFLNNIAWMYSGEEISNAPKNLETGKLFSQKSIEIIEQRLKNLNDFDDLEILQGEYNTFTDTYALLLYKEKKYKEAFDLQQAILEKNGLDTGGKERYAEYAEKTMGLDFAKNYIIKEFDGGLESKILYNQLKEIYKNQNFSDDKIENLTSKYKVLEIKKAPPFALQNLDGNTVNLEELKGKVVVLDFWATWCDPCVKSFPHMQKLVNKYKNNPDIVFLFINTLEGKLTENRKKRTLKLLNSKKYLFNVLFDDENNTSKSYNVFAIPTKVVIDKNGNILYQGFEDIEKNIEKALKK